MVRIHRGNNLSFWTGRGSISRISTEQGFDHVVSNEPTRCLQSNIRSMWINVSKMKTFVVARERESGSEERGEKNRWTMAWPISFFPLVLFEIEAVDADASRLATCREFSYISAEYRNLSVSSDSLFVSRCSAGTLIFLRSIEQRKGKKRRSRIPSPPPIYLQRVISRFSTECSTYDLTPYHASITS